MAKTANFGFDQGAGRSLARLSAHTFFRRRVVISAFESPPRRFRVTACVRMLLVVGAVAVGWSVIAWTLRKDPLTAVMRGTWTLVFPDSSATFYFQLHDDGRWTLSDLSGVNASGEWWIVQGRLHTRSAPESEPGWTIGRLFGSRAGRVDDSLEVFRIDVFADGNVDLVHVPSKSVPGEYTLHLQRD